MCFQFKHLEDMFKTHLLGSPLNVSDTYMVGLFLIIVPFPFSLFVLPTSFCLRLVCLSFTLVQTCAWNKTWPWSLWLRGLAFLCLFYSLNGFSPFVPWRMIFNGTWIIFSQIWLSIHGIPRDFVPRILLPYPKSGRGIESSPRIRVLWGTNCLCWEHGQY
jgi:hypothetical protein